MIAAVQSQQAIVMWVSHFIISACTCTATDIQTHWQGYTQSVLTQAHTQTHIQLVLCITDISLTQLCTIVHIQTHSQTHSQSYMCLYYWHQPDTQTSLRCTQSVLCVLLTSSTRSHIQTHTHTVSHHTHTQSPWSQCLGLLRTLSCWSLSPWSSKAARRTWLQHRFFNMKD